MLHRPVEVTPESGRSDAEFREPDFANLGRAYECLLFSIADVQFTGKCRNRTSANGQKRTSQTQSIMCLKGRFGTRNGYSLATNF